MITALEQHHQQHRQSFSLVSGCHTIVPDRREEKETGKSQSKTQAQNAQPEAVSREDEGSAVMSLHKLSSAMATRVGCGGGPRFQLKSWLLLFTTTDTEPAE